jgi:hypothetical protein
MTEYHFKDYIISFDKNIKFETFEEKDYRGITFILDDGNAHYEVIHNFAMGYRLLINTGYKNFNGVFKDVPFKEATFGMLPPGVTAKENK